MEKRKEEQTRYKGDYRVAYFTHILLAGIPDGLFGSYKKDLATSIGLGGHINNYPSTPAELKEQLCLEIYKKPTKEYQEENEKKKRPPPTVKKQEKFDPNKLIGWCPRSYSLSVKDGQGTQVLYLRQ